ncbi:UvrB/UvrC motif-containing protein [Staphylospora marina]|uniref:UvrB/UvrC motif-containing protein n=1 Tax=Staphylospora marina TaxID=2490858 RepID=UPI000F5C0A3E|nr:UvrB/UvrC motif-containing protein [Staphylospora marina]
MLCPECGKRPATLHYTKIVNGIKTELHLCEFCAQEKGLDYMPGFESGGFSFHQLLSGLLNLDPPSGPKGRAVRDGQGSFRCTTCGLTYNQFSKVGRFGCADCYKAFRDRLEPLLRRIHGHSTHRGKIPSRNLGEIKIRRQLEKLKHELALRIQAEEFEEAARLRDRIRELQQRLKQ